jgi:hypothetical protein
VAAVPVPGPHPLVTLLAGFRRGIIMKSSFLVGLAGSAILALAFATPSRAVTAQSLGFYEETVNVSCSNAFGCSDIFSPVPAGKTLLVTNVSCHFVGGGNSLVNSARLIIQSGIGIVSFLNVSILHSASSFRRFLSNTEVNKIFVSPVRPAVTVGFATLQPNISMQCTISGQLKP